MLYKSIIGVVASALTVVSFNATALPMPTSVDWKTAGDNLITYDPINQWEWLDLTVTAGMSLEDVSAQRGTGGAFEGWRIASLSHVTTLWDHFGGSGIYGGWRTDNNGLFDAVAPLMGDLYCEENSCNTGDGYSSFMTKTYTGYYHDTGYYRDYFAAKLSDLSTNPLAPTHDATSLNTVFDWYDRYPYAAPALFRTVSTPEPSIAILIGSGLIGLTGFARRKKA